MDLIKIEPGVDPLHLQAHDNTYEIEENKASSEEEKLSHLKATIMKTECMDQTYDIKSEIKIEDSPVLTSFVFVKSEVDEDMFDVDGVQQEQKVEVSSEEDEVFPERIAATNERTVSSEFDGIPLEENETVCQIPKNSGSLGKLARIRENEKQVEFELSEICFPNSTKLNCHIPKDEVKIPLKCVVCGKCFATKSILKIHELRHTGEKSFRCDVCGKCFATKISLKRHELRHTGEKSFKCDVCGKSFTEFCTLRRHERVHTGEKRFKCNICSRHFSYSSTLKVHILEHSGEKPFKCDICGMRFMQLYQLKTHEYRHTGEKPFKCHVCGKCFSQPSTLKNHEPLHTGEKPFKCEYCGTCFTRLGNLRRHILAHGPETVLL